MFSFTIINPPEFNIDEKIVKKIFKILEKLEEKKQNWTLNLVFVSWKEIKKLNKTYRKIDKATDVLSFHYYDDFSNFKKSDLVWELIFCEEKIISQWKEDALWSEKEFYMLLIHSSLHILWYDHENEKDFEIMNKKEKEIWNEIFLG